MSETNSSETEIAVHPTGRASAIRMEDPQSLKYEGIESTNNRVKVTVLKGDKERQAGTFVHKDANTLYPGETRSGMELYARHYELLKDKGFPVPKTVRWIEDTQELLITDLTEDGQKHVFSGKELEYKTVDLSKYNLADLRDKMLAIADKADALGININTDTYFFIEDKDKNIEVILGDLGVGVYPRSEAGDNPYRLNPHYSRNEVLQLYEHITKKSRVQKLRDFFSRKRS